MRRLRISGYRRAPVSRSRGYTRSLLRRRNSRYSDREGHRSEHQDRGDEERHPRNGRGGVRTDEPGEDQCEQNRTDDACQARDARVGALQLPLFRRTDAARHETLQRRLDKADRREHDDREEEDVRSRGETPHDERGGSGNQARDPRIPRSVALTRENTAAAQNGSRTPNAPTTPPTAGPRMKPMPQAAPTIPKAAARRSAGVTSAT